MNTVTTVVEILEHIKDLKCPHCGSRLDEERRWSLHTNGNWNESRKFDCGLILHFSPNFMRVEEESACRKSKPYIERSRKRQSLMDKINALIASSDVDDEFKDKIKYWLPNHVE